MAVTGDGTALRGRGGPAGFGETEVPRGDDGALQVDVSAVFERGIPWFAATRDAADVYVNLNGTVSFGAAYGAYPTTANSVPGVPLVAPFWGDVDTRLDGEGAESGSVWVDVDPQRDVVSVTWDRVGVYRRDAARSVTVQLELHDLGGGDLDVVFRYQHVGWVQGSAPGDAGARAGLWPGGTAAPVSVLPAGADAAALQLLPGQPGNTGIAGLWVFELRDGALVLPDGPGTGGPGDDAMTGTAGPDDLAGGAGNDTLDGGAGHDTLDGGPGDDRIAGGEGRDTARGGDGTDTIDGGPGDDSLAGGATEADRRDVIYGGDGNDTIDGGFGNDELRGDAGNDVIAGGSGSDTVIGGAGDDVLTGSAFSDLLFGGDGMDFVNGGFGSDRVNGGTGADRFFHLGVEGHGSDWIQDFAGDILVFGDAGATPARFQVNVATTSGAGAPDVAEAFVIYRPT
ncbi:calcium-binding protein, partial [Roseivivax isoporae]